MFIINISFIPNFLEVLACAYVAIKKLKKKKGNVEIDYIGLYIFKRKSNVIKKRLVYSHSHKLHKFSFMNYSKTIGF